MAGVGAKICLMVEPSLKLGFQFNRHSLCGKQVVPRLQWFLVFDGPNRSEAVAKIF